MLLILEKWWWLFLPLVLYYFTLFFYKWWISWDIWDKKKEWQILEIIPPGEITKPFKAMENVMSNLWAAFQSTPDWKAEWCEGEPKGGSKWWSFEIVSFEGNVHFYLRIPKDSRTAVESIIHSNYPEAEILEAEDYTQKMPPNLPNKEYDFYGEEYALKEDYAYPIKTYKDFEPTKTEQIEGEKKIDPIYNLLEALSKLNKKEQFWFQIIAIPIKDKDFPWKTHTKEVANKLAQRPTKSSQKKTIPGEAFNLVFKAKIPFEEGEEEKGNTPYLTPREKEILSEVENKTAKSAFKTSLRALYFYPSGKKFAPHSRIASSYFANFSEEDMNNIGKEVATKVKYFFKERRVFKRKRRMLKNYILRYPGSFPQREGKLLPILNTEELTTIFHFPVKSSDLPPGIPRVMGKKGGPPPGIPTE